MFYIRTILLFLWLFFSFSIGTVIAVLTWGRIDLNYYFSKFFSWIALKILGLKVVVYNKELLEAKQPAIYMVNHQSGMDVITFASIFPHRCTIIGKKELIFVPLLGLYFPAAGNILIDRQKRSAAVSSLGLAAAQIQKRKVSVWIFPEGTRNRTEEPLLPFKRGGFYLAVQTGLPIIPVVCEELRKNYSWKFKRIVPGIVKMKVLPMISTQGVGPDGIESLVTDVRSRMLDAYLELSRK